MAELLNDRLPSHAQNHRHPNGRRWSAGESIDPTLSSSPDVRRAPTLWGLGRPNHSRHST